MSFKNQFVLSVGSHRLPQAAHRLPCRFSVVYVVISEIFPMGVRGRAASVVAAVNWAINLLISMTFLTITGASSYISIT